MEKKNGPKISKKLKENLMKKLQVSDEELEATLKSICDSGCVTPFLSYTDEMCQTFMADAKAYQEFNQAKSFEDRLKICYVKISSHPAHRDIKHIFPDQVDPRESSKSQKSYEEAEDLFDDEEYEAALDKFSEAMLLSPVKVERVQDRVTFRSSQVALAVAGRAKVFLEIGNHYKECLEDIETALLFGCPEEKLYELFELQMECYIKLGRKADARDSLEMLATSMKKLNLNQNDKTKLIKEFQRKILDSEREDLGELITLKLEDGFQQIHPKVSDTIVIGDQPFLANKDIQPGEIILVQRPTTWFLSGIRWGTNCHLCCEPLVYTLIPSPFHPRAIFCSVDCFHKAISTDFHYLESRLDLRGIFELTSHSILEQAKRKGTRRLSDPNSVAAFLTVRAILHKEVFVETELEAKESTEDPDLNEIMQIVFIFKLLNILESSKKTEMPKKNELSCEELLKAFQIHKLKSAFKFRQIQISQSENEIIPGCPFQLHDIGFAIYPKLFQHSCGPNCAKVFRGNQIVLFAKQFIPQGTPLTISYGPHFSNLNKPIRQAQLKTCFGIHCKCSACKLDFPLLPNIPDDLDGKSFERGKNPFRLLKLFEDEAKCDNWLSAFKHCCKFLTLLQDLQVQMPNRVYEAGGHALSCTLWKIYGNCLKTGHSNVE